MKDDSKLNIKNGLMAAGSASAIALVAGFDPVLVFLLTTFCFSISALAEAAWIKFNN
jgi:hypothetical protein